MSTNKRSIDPAIIAALIGVMGTICVTIITLYANRIVPPPQSQTTPPPAIGSDWANGCISVLWKPYPETQTTANNGCLAEPVDLFFAQDGRLTFVANGRYADSDVHGLFAQLPSSGTVNISAFLRSVQGGEIWMGIFAEPTINSQGTIMVIPPGDVKKRLLIQKSMPGQVEGLHTQQFSQTSPLYDISFEFGNGAVKTIILRDTVFDPVPVVSRQPWLFVGYQVKKGSNRIDADFLKLVVQGQ